MSGTETPKNLVHLVLDGMPPWIRALVFSILAFPLVIAISGMMLQVNVGSTIERVIDAQFEKQGIEQIEAQRAQLESMLAPVLEAIDQLNTDTTVLSTNFGTMEERLTKSEEGIKAITEWACGPIFSDGKPENDPKFCK